jgi:arylsulfatase A-like enzyme
MIKAPGVTRPGTRTDQPVSLMDMYPTLAELAGFEIPSHVDGSSLVSLMRNPAATHEPVITSYRIAANPAWHLGPVFEPQIGHAVRSMNCRYIYYPGTGLEELYDHKTDPHEWDNVAYKAKYADVVQQHRQYLLKMIPGLTWQKGNPKGYAVSADGTVRNTTFMRMSDVR